MWGWGQNEFGELGLGHDRIVPSPKKLSVSSVRDLHVGFGHVIAQQRNP
jgi:hypothetical protein